MGHPSDSEALSSHSSAGISSESESETEIFHNVRERDAKYRYLKCIYQNRTKSQWEEVETPYREVTISLADCQICQEVGSGPSKTIVSHLLWQRYLQRARALNEDTSDYDRFYRRYRRGAKPRIQVQMENGNTVQVFNTPFKCKLRIGPITVIMLVYVTTDPHFGSDFVLGCYDWPVMAIKTKHAPKEAPSNAAHIDCNGPGGRKLRTLVDTGAGPNVLSLDAFLKMGYSEENLEPNRYELLMVDNSDLVTKGYFPSLEVCLANTRLKVPCTIVDGLGFEELILGRDFLMKYDVSLDLPRRQLTVRNPHGRYTIANSVEEIQGCHFTAVPKMQTTIAPETISCVNYEVKTSQRTNRGSHSQKKRSWLATVEAVDDYYHQKNVTVPEGVLTVREGVTRVPLLNASWRKEQEAELLPQTGRLRVKPLREVYQRKLVDSTASAEEQIFSMDREGNVVDMASQDPMESDMDSQCTSEPPVEITRDPTPFPTRPPTKHLKDKLKYRTLSELDRLLLEFHDVFSKNKTDVGRVTCEEHNIELIEGAKPCKETYRRLSSEKRECADRQVEELLKRGLISPSQSPFASGVIMIKKTDGSYRLAIDFRKLNTMTERNSFPLPIDETLCKLGDAKYFTTLDLGKGIWQIPLAEEAKERTAFVTHRGQYHWNLLPFGLCNARATCQRLITKVLANITQKYGNVVLSYMSDIVIATRTEDEHLQQLRAVLTACRDANLKLKAAKCRLFETEIKFLGRIVTPEGVKPDPANIQCIQSWKPPTDKKELAGFLSFAGYYREFVKGYAEIVSPLQKLKKRNEEFMWGPEQQRAFEQVKQTLVSSPVVGMPTQDGMYVLDTDASDTAIAGILHQWQHSEEIGKPVLRVIGHCSRRLTSSQTRYSRCEA